MIIASSAIELASQRQYAERHEKRESLRVQQGNRRLEASASSLSATVSGEANRMRLVQSPLVQAPRDQVNLSDQTVAQNPLDTLSEKGEEDDGLNLAPKIRMFKLLLEKMLGKKVDNLKVEDFKPKDLPPNANTNANGAQGQAAAGGFGLAYDYHESYFEAERTQFSASGKVTTSDGKEINFQLGLEMSREFYTEQSVSLRMGTLTDPLTLNFEGNSAQLTDSKFSFDLDGDGDEERVSLATGGSGFLALDRNGDGTINDGSELFGATTGNGFAELATYDEDGNFFIDQGDSVFDSLRLYSKTEAGEDLVQTLAERGVGAIYLGSTATPFRITDHNNETRAQVRESGVFISEDGSVGTVQQLDLASFDEDPVVAEAQPDTQQQTPPEDAALSPLLDDFTGDRLDLSA